MMRHFFTCVAAASMVASVSAPATGFDLTGSWSGTTECHSLFEGENITFKDQPFMSLTQTGDTIGVRATYPNGDVDFYTGIVHPDAQKPDTKGEIALIACGTDSVAGNGPAFDEVGRFTVAAKPDKIKATLTGLSFFSDIGIASPEAGGCKWKLARIDTTDAAIATTCAASSLRALGRAVSVPSRARRRHLR